MNAMQIKALARILTWAVGVAWLVGSSSVLADVDLTSKFSNQGSIANTRHNLTERQATGGPNGSSINHRDGRRRGLRLLPHAARCQFQPRAALWNRTIKATTYTTYDQLGTSSLTQPVSQPGPNSLACLSCHDGQVGIDSVINMPGSGGYLASQATSQSNSFLNGWNDVAGPRPRCTSGWTRRRPAAASPAIPLAPGWWVPAPPTSARSSSAPICATTTRWVCATRRWALAWTSTHPPPRAGMRWFDTNGNGHPDSREVRLYDSGEGHGVRCASCHDPPRRAVSRRGQHIQSIVPARGQHRQRAVPDLPSRVAMWAATPLPIPGMRARASAFREGAPAIEAGHGAFRHGTGLAQGTGEFHCIHPDPPRSVPMKAASLALAAAATLSLSPLAQAADGKAVYDATCVVCHASGVANAPKLGDKEGWGPRMATGEATQVGADGQGCHAAQGGQCQSQRRRHHGGDRLHARQREVNRG